MQVMSGLSWEDSHGRWHKVEVYLDENDISRLRREGELKGEFGTVDAWKALQKTADAMAGYECFVKGGMTREELSEFLEKKS